LSQDLAPARLQASDILRYAAQLAATGVLYWAFAKFGLALASINASASPIWAPSGLALAATLLWGYRVAPAIFTAAFFINLATAGTIYTSLAIGVGNTLEAMVGAALIRRFCGPNVFDSPVDVAKFGLICCLAGTPLAATIGVVSLALTGFAAWDNFAPIWATWWLGDLGGIIVVAPPILLWAKSDRRLFAAEEILESFAVFLAAAVIGLIAFSPFAAQTADRAALAFLSILPLMWAALRRGQRDTATVALILSVFAVWGTMAGSGPFASPVPNDAFLLLLMFTISTVMPSLALAADVAGRARTEAELRRARTQLSRRVEQGAEALADVEQTLETQRAQLLEAQRLADFGSWVWNIADGRLVWSDQLFKIYGITPNEFAGTFEDFLGRIHPDDRIAVELRIAESLKTGRSFRLAARIVRPDGEIRHLQSSGEVVMDENKKAIRLLGVSQDVTDSKAAAAELEQVREHLAQARKLEAIGQLTGGVAHDFNNLLMIVGGHAQIMKNKLSDPKLLQAVEAIMTATRRGESLTRQLLSFARRQTLSPAPVNLEKRIAAVRDLITGSLRGDILVRYDFPATLWNVHVDAAELELALLNIAVNARDAMPDGGTFRISARNITFSIPQQDGLTGDFVALSLSDTGSGIQADVLPKVFEPFFSTKADKGSGLGLSQVHGFAHQSEGTVTLASEVGSGTTVTLYLPRSKAPAAKAEEPKRTESLEGRGTILLVEDNAEVGTVTTELLAAIGYRVRHTRSAAEALQILANERVDLVFADIVMPGAMNGLALAQTVRARFAHIPVLLTSGYGDIAKTAEDQFPVLRKPFETSTLQRAVQTALREGRHS
jgi:PAS domain S-box-containing protein